MIVSSIVVKQGKTEIDQWLRKSFSSPALKIVVTLAVLKSLGKIPSSKDNLNLCNKGLPKDPKQLLITPKIILS